MSSTWPNEAFEVRSTSHGAEWEKRVAKAIEEYEKTRADSNNTGGSGSANTGGTVAPYVQGCSYKTFMNGKPHSFSGSEGVVRLKRWFEKMEQVFEICKCAEDDKHMTTEYCPATEIQRMEQDLWTLTLKGDDIEAYNNRFHELALRIGDSNKRKWEDQQGNNYHQQQNRRQEAAKVYVAALAKGRGYAGNLPQCNRCKAHHQPVERVGPVAYRLKLPQELSCVHDTFHVSNLKKCLAEPDVQVPLDEIEIDENLHFVEEPIEIVEQDVKS
ncbi:hypothetical protein Tco_0305188 [Tanacetum coccineum]